VLLAFTTVSRELWVTKTTSIKIVKNNVAEQRFSLELKRKTVPASFVLIFQETNVLAL
jgi:hypothetical protein